MRRGLNFLPAQTAFPFAGVNGKDPSTQANPKFSPTSLSVLYKDGFVQSRKGYVEIGSATDPALTLDVPLTVEFEAADGTKHLVISTLAKQYEYNTSTDAWDDITVDGVDLTGDEDDVFDWTVGTGADGKWLIVTNGKDLPRYWDGSGLFLELDPSGDITGFTTCKTVEMYRDHLFLGGIESTNLGSRHVAWSDTNDLDDFGSGNSGTNLIADGRGAIKMLKLFGDRLAVYHEDSIGFVTHVGGTVLFSFEQRIQGTGLVSGNSVVEFGPYHIYASQENFMLFDGSRLLIPVGDNVSEALREDLNFAQKERMTGFLDTVRRKAFWLVPTVYGGVFEGIKVYTLEYELFRPETFRWGKIGFAHNMVSMGLYSRVSSLKWEDVTETWEEFDLSWNDASFSVGFPTRVMGDQNGNTYLDTESLLDDDGAVIAARWDTIDFTVPPSYVSQMGRWLEVELEAKGIKAEVRYSTDQGNSYTSLATQTLTSAWVAYKFYVDTVSRTFRVQVRTPSSGIGGFKVRWLRVWLKEGPPR